MSESKSVKVSGKKLNCYVIMSLDDKYKVCYETIKDAVNTALGREDACNRANEATIGSLTTKIIPDMLNADIIIAMLSIPEDGENLQFSPSVQYELGLAHSFRKPTIYITTRGKDGKPQLPFYLLQENTQIYEKNDKPDDIKRKIVNTITKFANEKETAGEYYIPSNPITIALKHVEVKSAFVDDLKGCEALDTSNDRWLWGYVETYKRKLRASETWAMTSDLHWYYTDVPYSCLLKRAIKAGQKYRILYTSDKKEAQEDIEKLESKVKSFVGTEEARKHLKIIHTEYKAMLNFTIYDPGDVAEQNAIFLEPMEHRVGQDAYDRILLGSQANRNEADHFDEGLPRNECARCEKDQKTNRAAFPALKSELKDDCPFSKKLSELPTTLKWKDRTFDIKVHSNSVNGLKDIFRTEWNNAIKKEIKDKDEAESWKINY